MDTNQDGVVDQREFIAGGGTRDEFEHYDVNGDGVLDGDELVHRAAEQQAYEERSTVAERAVQRAREQADEHRRIQLEQQACWAHVRAEQQAVAYAERARQEAEDYAERAELEAQARAAQQVGEHAEQEAQPHERAELEAISKFETQSSKEQAQAYIEQLASQVLEPERWEELAEFRGGSAVRSATVAVDVDGDGIPDYIVSGADRDGDGIPDALQVIMSYIISNS